jgi:hypothetical protein
MQNSVMHETVEHVTYPALEVKYLLIQETDKAVRQFVILFGELFFFFLSFFFFCKACG